MYACLYIPSFPAQAVLRLKPELRRQAVAILDGESQCESILSANTPARKIGVRSGMTRIQAESFSNVVLLRRSILQEHATKAALIECGLNFSPLVEPIRSVFSVEPGSGIVIDIQGMQGLFGSPAQLASKLRNTAGAYGLLGHTATSANFHVAVCIARGKSGTNAIRHGEEAAALAPLPLDVLDLSPEMSETFHLWGIKSCGMLAKLPAHELVARTGVEGQHLRDLASGAHPHHFIPYEPDFASQLTETIEIEHPIELVEPLLFLFARLLDQLLLRVQSRSLAIASVQITLRLEANFNDDAIPQHVRFVRPAVPSQDARRLLKILQLDLETHPPQAPVIAIEMKVEAAKPHVAQHGLFLPQGPEPDKLEELLGRLQKLMGEDRVGAPQLMDTLKADGFTMRSFAPPPPRDHGPNSQVTNPPAAFRVCRPPFVIGVTIQAKQPLAVHIDGETIAVVMHAGPWRRSGEWWSQSNWCREEWDVLLADRSSEKICRIAHDPSSRCWYLVGTYD
jgi:protein ImuB